MLLKAIIVFSDFGIFLTGCPSLASEMIAYGKEG
jgi:hypothetical protein